jgi:hypothetical protein
MATDPTIFKLLRDIPDINKKLEMILSPLIQAVMVQRKIAQ